MCKISLAKDPQQLAACLISIWGVRSVPLRKSLSLRAAGSVILRAPSRVRKMPFHRGWHSVFGLSCGHLVGRGGSSWHCKFRQMTNSTISHEIGKTATLYWPGSLQILPTVPITVRKFGTAVGQFMASRQHLGLVGLFWISL